MDQLISKMSTEEFDAIIDQYIERESQDMDEVQAPIFYQALQDIFAVSEVEETVELQGNVVNSQLELLPRESGSILPGIVINGNEIIVNQVRIVIHLNQPTLAMA